MRLVLRRGTKAAFEAAGDTAFTVADSILVTDPPTLISSTPDRDGRLETPLDHDPSIDVSELIEFEVRRIRDDVVVRIGQDAWITKHKDAIRFVFPRTIGNQPVAIGHGSI